VCDLHCKVSAKATLDLGLQEAIKSYVSEKDSLYFVKISKEGRKQEMISLNWILTSIWSHTIVVMGVSHFHNQNPTSSAPASAERLQPLLFVNLLFHSIEFSSKQQ
jgi:hypothetical protein